MEITWILYYAIASLILFLFMLATWRQQYWRYKGIAYIQPLPVVGNLLNVIRLKQSIGELYREAYLKFPNKKLVGIYELHNPVLIAKDPELIEKILIKDFQCFVNRPQIVDDDSLFAYGLFQLRGTFWRAIRHKISPAFTSGKLKGMFDGMMACAEKMKTTIDENLNTDYEVREAFSMFTIGVIANSVFGIEINDKEALKEFTIMATSVSNTTPKRFIDTIALSQFPKIASKLGFKYLPNECDEYFKGLIRTTLKQRVKENIQRNDYTQQLLKLKELEVLSHDGSNFEISDDLLTGQAFQFLSAGFDPILNVALYVLYELSLNPEIQERARGNVQEVLQKHNGVFSYESIKDMTYLEQCLQETLRIHPILEYLFRECIKKYHIPEENLEMYPGQKVIIPISALQMDPKYYPDPEKFNPERFPPNTFKNNFTYLPYGDGSRNCLGARYAMTVMKVGFAKILSQYKFKLSPKTKVPFDSNKQSFLVIPRDKILFVMTSV